MNISAEFVKAEPAVRDWIEYVFSVPECACGFDPNGHDWKAVDAMMDDVESGTMLCMIPSVDGVAAGLFWGRLVEGGIMTTHQTILPKFRRQSCALAKFCAEKAFADCEWITHIIGFTPADNRAAILVALRAGFKPCGNVPHLHVNNKGDRVDCVMTVRVRKGV